MADTSLAEGAQGSTVLARISAYKRR